MNLFKKKKTTTNAISHSLINKKKRKFPEPIITIRQIEEKDVDEVRQLLHDHFNSLTLPAVVYWSIQHIYDLLVIIAINYIFFLDIRKIFYFLGVFVIYLYIRAKLEFLRHIRKDCPDLDNLYKSYVNVEGCNFWVAEVFDSNSDSVSRTTCSDIYEREKVIGDHDKEESVKAINNDTGDGSVGDVDSGDEVETKSEKQNGKNAENEIGAMKTFIDETNDEKNKEIENDELKSHGEGKFGEKNDCDVESGRRKGDEKKTKEEHVDNKHETEELNENVKSTENEPNKNESEERTKEGEEKETKEHYETDKLNVCEKKMNASKYKSANDSIEEIKSNKQIDANRYTDLYCEKNNEGEENKQTIVNDMPCRFTECKNGESKMQNISETTDISTSCIDSNNNAICFSSDGNKNNNSDSKGIKDNNNDNNVHNDNINTSNHNESSNTVNNSNNNYGIIYNTTSNNNNNNNNNNNSSIAKIKDDEDYGAKYMNKKIVGCVGIVPYKGDSSIAQLVRMVVKKDNRRMRIGSRLLAQLENFAYEQNYKELKVFTNNLNTDSLYFVKQHGFNLSQIVRRGLMRGDLLIWSKILNKDDFYKFNSTDIQSYTTNILD